MESCDEEYSEIIYKRDMMLMTKITAVNSRLYRLWRNIGVLVTLEKQVVYRNRPE